MGYGGREGISDLKLVESAIGRPYSGYHRPIERKVAALLHSVATNHGFLDGNKRTALLLSDLLLARSGYSLEQEHDSAFADAIVDVVERRMDFEQLVVWLEHRIVRI